VNSEIAADLLARGTVLSGSVITVDPDLRLDAARQLVESGALIHADTFGAGYTLMDGASRELLSALSRQWPSQLDIHIMAEGADAVVSSLVLSHRVHRVTVHARPGDELAAVRAAIGLIADQWWLSIDAHEWSAPALAGLIARTHPDGVLQMLAPAGVPGQLSDLSKLDEPSWALARSNGPLGVDGGVQPDAFDRLVDAGVSYFVMGRSLLG
jgi:pentose-5-phosphate-3-epimerase